MKFNFSSSYNVAKLRLWIPHQMLKFVLYDTKITQVWHYMHNYVFVNKCFDEGIYIKFYFLQSFKAGPHFEY